MGGISYTEMLVIAVVGLVLFGPNKIPEFARQCGRAVHMFKQGLKEGMEEVTAGKPAQSDERGGNSSRA